MRASTRGITLVEILVVLGILALLSMISVLTFTNIRNHQSLQVASEDVYGALIDARSRTLGSSGDEVHGVRIEEDRVVLFAGVPYDSDDTDNEYIVLPPTVTATSSLSNGAIEVVFERLTGEASETGTISLIDATMASNTITIHASGLIEQ